MQSISPIKIELLLFKKYLYIIIMPKKSNKKVSKKEESEDEYDIIEDGENLDDIEEVDEEFDESFFTDYGNQTLQQRMNGGQTAEPVISVILGQANKNVVSENSENICGGVRISNESHNSGQAISEIILIWSCNIATSNQWP
jgi:hypothetical protein